MLYGSALKVSWYFQNSLFFLTVLTHVVIGNRKKSGEGRVTFHTPTLTGCPVCRLPVSVLHGRLDEEPFVHHRTI